MFFRKKIKPQIMITIPEPCDEQWSEMRVVDNCHRHCASCERTLTDFAQMNDDELLIFFKHSQGKICGHFRTDQLNRPLTPLPEKTSKANWWKAAALLPLTLFSKSASAQYVDSDSSKTVQDAPLAIDSITLPPLGDIWDHPIDTNVYQWKWDFPGEVVHMNGVPMITGTYTLSPLCVTAGYVVTIDTSSSPPIKSASAVGIEAATSPAPAKKSDAPNSSQAALHFQAIVPDTTKNK